MNVRLGHIMYKGGEIIKRYMLLMKTDDGYQSMRVFDDYHHVVDAYNICTVSMGWYAEVYEYISGSYVRIA